MQKPYRYDKEYVTKNPFKHGCEWNSEELRKLENLFRMCHELSSMCEILGRSTESLLAKLAHLKLIYRNADNRYYYVTGTFSVDTYPTPNQGTDTMTTPNIETKTFIAGADATDMTDLDVILKIEKIEQQIARLKAVKVTSSRITAMIAEFKQDVADLAQFLDERYDAS